jgi:hypothetical protein
MQRYAVHHRQVIAGTAIDEALAVRLYVTLIASQPSLPMDCRDVARPCSSKPKALLATSRDAD